mmetsp:Transcript_36419/g.36807  ORF Transcript_36419/g.36807 Transcript_36419/m.36807 type:complete len:152 (+) Transcript_36419:1096-1551(+)
MTMKHVTEYVRDWRYKLKAIGIPVKECAYIYGGNKSVLANSGTPHFQLKKRSNSVAFHYIQEGSALDKWRITYINTDENIADLMTKNIPSRAKRMKFCKMLLYFLTPSIDIEDESNHAVVAAAVKVLPGRWIEAIIDAVKIWETELVASPA